MMKHTATRLITLIMLLQQKPNQKAADLAKQLDVSVRTLHRHIDMLDEMGIPVYSERGPHGGFSLVRGYKMPPLVLTPEEAVAVYLGTNQIVEMWGNLYREAAQGALAKLQNILPNEQVQEIEWAQQTLLATHMHRADFTPLMPVLEEIRQATRNTQCLDMCYQGRGQTEPTQRTIDPYALVHRWGWWYLIGYCHIRDDVRSFRIDRIRKLTPLDQTFERPDDFDAHRYFESEPHAQQPRITVKLRFAPEAATLVNDDPGFWDRVEEQPDKGIIATLRTPDLEWAARITLGYGPYVVVMEPPELRELVYERTRASLEQYTNQQEGERE